MSKIYFRNSTNWTNVYAIVDNMCIELNSSDVKDLYDYDFDYKKYESIYFSNMDGEQTEKVFPGAFSVCVEYRYNEKMGKCLTYLFNKDVLNTGRVDNYVIMDEINLAYRKDKCKKISVFVPSTYNSQTPHGILYFFDAQNLFCGAGEYTQNGDPYGSWQLDMVILELHRQYGENIIVVGVDNADEYRSHELFMNPDTFGDLSILATAIPDDDFSKGYLDNLSEFIRNTLHPFIKENYCIKEDCIGIGGSSMGGIASFYCGLKEESFYKYILSYSPAYGLYEMSAFEKYFESKSFAQKTSFLPCIHIYCGGSDMLEQQLLPSSKAMKTLLSAYEYPSEKIFETYDDSKPHNEESWRLILCDSFTKLFEL